MANIVQLKARPVSDIGALLTSWADVEERPRALVQLNLVLLWASDLARDVLSERRDIMLRDGVLTMIDHANSDALASFVRQAGPDPSHWCSARRDGDGHLLFSARLMQTAEGVNAVGLVFHGTGADFAPVWIGFKEAFGLTVAESEVIAALLDGETADRIGDRLAITVDTVRTHIRNAYVKLDVSSREQMFRRLSPFLEGRQNRAATARTVSLNPRRRSGPGRVNRN